MPRTLSSTAAIAANAQATGEVFVVLLELDHPALAEPIRVADNSEDVVSGGETFVAYPFALVLPDDDGEKLPQAAVRIDNVDRVISDQLRALVTAPTAVVRVVLASQPDTVELIVSDLTLQSVQIDPLSITGTLGYEDLLGTAFGSETYNPSTCPGLF